MSTWLQNQQLCHITVLILKANRHGWYVDVLIACRISSSCWCDACEVLTLICSSFEAQVFSPQPPFINSICTDSLLKMSEQMRRCLWNLLFWVSVSFTSTALHFCGSGAYLCYGLCPPDTCVIWAPEPLGRVKEGTTVADSSLGIFLHILR